MHGRLLFRYDRWKCRPLRFVQAGHAVPMQVQTRAVPGENVNVSNGTGHDLLHKIA